MSINTCVSNLNVSETTQENPCEEFCNQFNPVTYHKYLEGDLNKYYAYSMTIKNMSKKLQEDYDHENNKKDLIVQKHGRLLESAMKKYRIKYKPKKLTKRILAATKL